VSGRAISQQHAVVARQGLRADCSHSCAVEVLIPNRGRPPRE